MVYNKIPTKYSYCKISYGNSGKFSSKIFSSKNDYFRGRSKIMPKWSYHGDHQSIIHFI